jgi:uncharacterized protein
VKHNRLGEEKSPYLLQHKDNPVHWFAWGDEAFQAAKSENKPIFLSIGYSTCYWCHVMEKDSFETEEVANVLNKYFINIKIDREERPDIDQIYMDAVVAMTGQGGWPMSVFLTPDLKPFYGGTFFYRAQFISLLEQINGFWGKDYDRIVAASNELTSILKKYSQSNLSNEPLNDTVLKNAFYQFTNIFDENFGGFGKAPKFPHSESVALLLRIYKRSSLDQALSMATKTLDYMASGGIYDHLGFGFHRYSTDVKWFAPHFEKMLYDNALLSKTYFEAYQITKNEMHYDVGKQILDYVIRDMSDEGGGFYSAEDAGDVGKEGEFYTWSFSEIKSLLLPEELEMVTDVYNISAQGNFEHGQNILHLSSSADWAKKKHPLIESASKKLRSARNKRRYPHKDDKILTSWNGLMISAMSKGYQITGDISYLKAGQKSALFIKENLYKDNSLLRRYRQNEARFAGVLEDYAYLIAALIDLYESDFNIDWILWAIELQNIQNDLFWDSSSDGYFYTNKDELSLIVRKKDFHDGAVPSANGVSALNLLRLYNLTFELNYLQRAKDTLHAAASSGLTQNPSGYSSSAMALDYLLDNTGKQIVVVGDPDSAAASKIRKDIYQTFLPNKIFAFAEPTSIDDKFTLPLLKGKKALNNQTTIYVCENNVCKEPTNNPEAALRMINEFVSLDVKS